MSIEDVVIEEYNRQNGDAPPFISHIVRSGMNRASGVTLSPCDGGCGFVWESWQLREVGGQSLCWLCSMAYAREMGICLDPSIWPEYLGGVTRCR